MSGYYEIEFANLIDIIKFSKDMKMRLGADKNSQFLTKLWIFVPSDRVLYSCLAKQGDINALIDSFNQVAVNPAEFVREPIEAEFTYWER